MTATVPAAMRREDLPADCREAAALLNQGCVCRSVDSRRLKRALEAGGVAHEALTSSHPHLFSHTQVYVAQAHLDFIPERTSDFLFAVYSEEFGFVGNLVLLALYTLNPTRRAR